MTRWRRWSISVVVILALSWAGGEVFSLHLTDTGALRVQGLSSNRLYVLQEVPTWFGKSVLFEDLDHGTFGVANLKRTLFFFWQHNGGSYGYTLEPGQPFKATGYGSTNARATQQFVIGLKVEPPIQYITIGSEDPTVEEQAGLTLEHVQSFPKVYQTTPVVNGYALLVANDFTAAAYTFHAFDTNGRLVADQLYAHDPRWIR